jgi:uncharacterized protein
MTEAIKQAKPPALSEQQVADYLAEHPNFFNTHEDLLLELKLPHVRGSAVSLVERQVGVLRERNRELRHRLNDFMQIARQNGSLFDNTSRLGLALLEADSLHAVINAVKNSLLDDFKMDAASLLLFGANAAPQQEFVQWITPTELNDTCAKLLHSNAPTRGPLREDEAAFLFPGNFAIASAAIAPLSYRGKMGVLALGSTDASHFASSMDTIFIDFLASLLARIFKPYL